MPKISRFRKNLLAVLVAAALVPMACRNLALAMVHPNRPDSGPHDSLNHSGGRSFGKMFLHELNCQSLEDRERFPGQESGAGMAPACAKALFVRRETSPAVSPPFEKRLFPTTGPIPLRI